MIHEDEETYITRRGEVIHKGVRCKLITGKELVRRFHSLKIDKRGHVRVGKRKNARRTS